MVCFYHVYQNPIIILSKLYQNKSLYINTLSSFYHFYHLFLYKIFLSQKMSIWASVKPWFGKKQCFLEIDDILIEMIELLNINDLARKKMIELYLLYKKKRYRSEDSGQPLLPSGKPTSHHSQLSFDHSTLSLPRHSGLRQRGETG